MPGVIHGKENADLKTDSYASILKVQFGKNLLKAHLIIKNEHGDNDLSYKVLESDDEVGADGTWYEPTETHLTAGSTAKKTLDPAPTWVDVQAIRRQITTPVDSKISVWLRAIGM